MVVTGVPAVGQLLRDWRTRRRLSLLDLSSAAGISSRHLSFVETGRSRPSREMVLHLADQLDVPLRERNALLIAGGFAPTFHATDLSAPEMQHVREATDRLLAAHEPYPAILVDRRWNLMAANRPAIVLVEGVAPGLLDPPCNVLRATLHPEGLSSRIVNLDEWFDHILGNLRRQVAVTGDDELRALADELCGYATELGVVLNPPQEASRAIAIPMRVRADDGELAFITMIATFGTALDITLTELAIETFLPADAATAASLQRRFGVASTL
jgi:transcriptional regulator with XRE-family HTH domain